MELLIGEQNKINVRMNPSVVMLGFFDGVHIGHASIINMAKQEAKKRGIVTVLHTFTTPPKTFEDNRYGEITPLDVKREILENMGLDIMVADVFDSAYKSMMPQDFFEKVIIGRLRAQVVICGFHYHFGAKGSGDINLLRELCSQYNITLIIVPPVMVGGELVSSTAIRALITAGDMGRAALMLGRNYYIKGEVVKGRSLGSRIGFPTINQSLAPGSVMPALGVYLTRTTICGITRFGVTNVGRRPSVSHNDPITVETYLFECNEDLYGLASKVEFLEMLRHEIKFASIDALQKQIAIDVNRAQSQTAKYQ